jgi:hypothetical protein
MAFEKTIQSIVDQMHVAASIATALGQARSQRDYATAASLLAILQEMPLRGVVVDAPLNTGYRAPAPSGYLF